MVIKCNSPLWPIPLVHPIVGASLIVCYWIYNTQNTFVFLQNLTSRIAYERPEDPLQFMLTEIEKVKKGEKLEELKSN